MAAAIIEIFDSLSRRSLLNQGGDRVFGKPRIPEIQIEGEQYLSRVLPNS